jgi:hypothetical protein
MGVELVDPGAREALQQLRVQAVGQSSELARAPS